MRRFSRGSTHSGIRPDRTDLEIYFPDDFMALYASDSKFSISMIHMQSSVEDCRERVSQLCVLQLDLALMTPPHARSNTFHLTNYNAPSTSFPSARITTNSLSTEHQLLERSQQVSILFPPP